MLTKKVASIITAAIRICLKCGARCTLSATSKETKCRKCGAVVNKEKSTNENPK